MVFPGIKIMNNEHAHSGSLLLEYILASVRQTLPHGWQVKLTDAIISQRRMQPIPQSSSCNLSVMWPHPHALCARSTLTRVLQDTADFLKRAVLLPVSWAFRHELGCVQQALWYIPLGLGMRDAGYSI